MSGYAIVIDRSSPHIIGQRARTRRPPTSPTIIGYTQNPVTTVGASSESVDTRQQPNINDQSDSDRGTENDDVRHGVVRCATPFLVRRRDTPPSPDPVLEPSEVVRGINKHGNRFRRALYPDRTDSYQYDNRDGSHYEKHRDGSADFHSSRGFTKHYPPLLVDEPVRSKKYDRGEVRDTFSKNRAGKGRKFKRRHKPQHAASRRTSPPPPPAPRGSRRSTKHKSKSRNQDSSREPRAF